MRFPGEVDVALDVVNERVLQLAAAQSRDVGVHLQQDGVTVVHGAAELDGPSRVIATLPDGSRQTLDADAILIATGAQPRELAAAVPDGERILSWTQLYDLKELPEQLIVVGSGVTGAEFACAYQALGFARHLGFVARSSTAR